MRYLEKTSLDPSDIEDALWGMQDAIFEIFSKPGVSGGPVSLLIVILPDQGNYGMEIVVLFGCTFVFLLFFG